jgi:hypothetical protein
LWSLCIGGDTWVLRYRGRSSCIHRPKLETLGHDQRGKHWHHLTRNGRLLSKDFHSWGSRLEITPSTRWSGCPNYWFWRCYLQVSSYTNFSSLRLGAKASSWKHLATEGALIKPLWKGFSWIRLQWTRGDQKFPQVRGNMMLSWPRCESNARWKAPIKKRREKKSEVGVEKNNAEWTLRGWNLPEQLDFDPPLKIWAWGKDDLWFGYERRLRWIAGRENRCCTNLIWRRWRLQSISE